MSVSSIRTASQLSRNILLTCRSSISNPTIAARTSLPPAASSRTFSSTHSHRQHEPAADDSVPRWAQTPPAMKGKFRLNPIRNPSRTKWTVNEDPDKLDQMYIRFLGKGGDRLLDEEAKWLAVTHKSFDFGRRGFNARLAYFGRNMLVQEAAQYILTLDAGAPPPDRHGREPFRHPALDRTNNFHAIQPAQLMDKTKIAKLGTEMGINQVMRWKPRLPENLAASGIDVVLNQAVFAIIGAVVLQQGTATAGRLVREKIFKRTQFEV